MTVTGVLREAKELLSRHHYQPDGRWLIAADAHGDRARPISPDAERWSVIGALCRVAPGQTVTCPVPYADLSAPGEAARVLLAEVAGLQGFLSLADVDRAGHGAVQRLFAAALNKCDPEPRRPRALSVAGSNPKGVTS